MKRKCACLIFEIVAEIITGTDMLGVELVFLQADVPYADAGPFEKRPLG
jgi:hypothetical protein